MSADSAVTFSSVHSEARSWSIPSEDPYEYEEEDDGHLRVGQPEGQLPEARVVVLETHARRLEWQRQAADDFTIQHIMRTQALEAGAHDDTLEDTKAAPQAPPSPNYVPGPEYPPLPDYVPGPEYTEYVALLNDEVPIEDRPLPADASADYPAVDDDDNDDYDDDDDDEEEEEHLAPADSVAPTPSPSRSPRTKSSPPLPVPSPPLPLPSPPTHTSLTYAEAPLGYRAAMVQWRATLPSTISLEAAPQAPPSPNYVPGPEYPPLPDYVPGPEYTEYVALLNDEVPIEAQPLPADASPTTLSLGYVTDFDPEEDQEEASEESLADYPAVDDDDNDDYDDDDDDEEEEEHLALADSVAPTPSPPRSPRTKKMPPKRTTTTTPMTDAAIKVLIGQGVATALTRYEANKGSGNGDDRHDSGSGRRTYRAAGHYKKDYPKLKNNNRGNSTGNGGATSRAYAVGNAGKNPDSNIVMGTFLLNNCYASILLDTGADRRFVSTAFSSLTNIIPTILDHDYDVELADGKIIRVNTIIQGCTLNFLNHPFNIDLMPIEIGSFDVIIGMDWLSMYPGVIVCDEKIVRIPFGNGILIIHGDGSNN
nr:reverse transcriptase domain-containing protein [Tanacetum cinerariifolium]